MPYTSEGSRDKIESVRRGRGWSESKRDRFHDWLQENYPDEKDSMSYSRLEEVANEFEDQDISNWNNERN